MFASLDIIRSFDLVLGAIDVPIRVHIKDIREELGSDILFNSEHIEYEDENGEFKSFTIGEPSKYETIRKLNNDKESLRGYFKFIDKEVKIFDCGDKTFMEYYNIDSLEELFEILDRSDFQTIKDKCDEMIKYIIDEFYKNIKLFLNNDVKCPTINTKPNNDVVLKQVTEYSNKPLGYLISQIGVEYPANIFFKENEGKAISEWSFREIQLQVLYISEKNRVDGLLEKWKAKKNEDSEKKK